MAIKVPRSFSQKQPVDRGFEPLRQHPPFRRLGGFMILATRPLPPPFAPRGPPHVLRPTALDTTARCRDGPKHAPTQVVISPRSFSSCCRALPSTMTATLSTRVRDAAWTSSNCKPNHTTSASRYTNASVRLHSLIFSNVRWYARKPPSTCQRQRYRSAARRPKRFCAWTLVNSPTSCFCLPHTRSNRNRNGGRCWFGAFSGQYQIGPSHNRSSGASFRWTTAICSTNAPTKRPSHATDRNPGRSLDRR